VSQEYGQLEALQVTVLLEENAGYNSSFLSQHGMSLLLEAWHGGSKPGKRTILFDTGQSAQPVLHNMQLLGKDPQDIDLIFLSHCHYDHTGGLVGILEASKRCRVPIVGHPSIYRPHFSLKPTFQSLGMGPDCSREAIEKAGGELILSADPMPLMPGAVSTGEINDRVSFEKSPTLSLQTIHEGKKVSDYMVDDSSLIFITEEGLIIITGCSHAGITSIVEAAVRLTGIEHVSALIGGFHLVDADQARISRTVQTITSMEVDNIYAGHCTGFKAEANLFMELGERFQKLHTGMTIKYQ